jgi:hypothetical protein
MYVIVPWSDLEPQCYRFADYGAYFRQVKNGLAEGLAEGDAEGTYPDPIAHCDICRWDEACDKRRRDDDHLCLVAGISKLQIVELKTHGVATLKDLAAMLLPLAWKPDRGSAGVLIPVREQVGVQWVVRRSHARQIRASRYGPDCVPSGGGSNATAHQHPAAVPVGFNLGATDELQHEVTQIRYAVETVNLFDDKFRRFCGICLRAIAALVNVNAPPRPGDLALLSGET